MKKKFALALALALSLSLTACNKPESKPAASSPEQSVTESTPEQPEEPAPEQPEEPAPTEPAPEQQPESTDPVETPVEQQPVEKPVETPVEVTKPVETKPVETTKPVEQTKPVDLFTDTNETVYATSTVNIRSKPDTNSKKLGQLVSGNSVNRIGVGRDSLVGWSEVKLTDGTIAYIRSDYLSTTKPVQQQPQQSKPAETQKPTQQQTTKPVEPSKHEDSNVTPEQEAKAKENANSHIESQHQAVMDMTQGAGDLYDGLPDENGNYSAYEIADDLKDGIEFEKTEEGVIGFIVPF